MIVYEGLKFKPWIKHKEILAQVKTLAEEVDKTYKGKEVVLVGVLNGCFRFMGDLSTFLKSDFDVSFVRVKSYEGTVSGKLKFLSKIEKGYYERKTVLFVEDIVESGKTLSFLEQEFINLGASEVKCLTLFYKPSELQSDYVPNHVGFEIENKFILGYGLDFNEKGRHLNDVYRLEE